MMITNEQYFDDDHDDDKTTAEHETFTVVSSSLIHILTYTIVYKHLHLLEVCGDDDYYC